MLQPLATAAATRSALPVATAQRTEYSAASITPWQTHLGSEEWPLDAKWYGSQDVFDASKGGSHPDVIQQLRYFDHYNGATTLWLRH
jgi:hypothetical protein